MKFTTIKEENIVTVTVELPSLISDKESGLDVNRTVLRENHVRNYLRKANIACGECIQKTNLDNMGDNLIAVWKFHAPQEKKVDKAPKPVVSSTRAKRTKTTRKRSKSKDE